MSKKTKQSSKKMGHVYEKSGHLLELFIYEHPASILSVRELADKTGLSKSTVQYKLKKLKSENVVLKDGGWADNWKNRLKKSMFYMNIILESGLIEFLDQEYAASAIILFGSFAKGESVRESDIDLFIECAKADKKVDLSIYEKKLGHKIELFTKNRILQLPPNLLNNVVNGIKLKGYYTIK